MRVPAVCLAALLLFGACGADDPPPETKTLKMGRSITLPRVKSAIAAYRVTMTRSVTQKLLKRVERVAGVPEVATIQLEKMTVTSPERTKLLKVGAIKPLVFRPLAPQPTRDAPFVWLSFLQGEGVLTPKAARRLDVKGATRLITGTQPVEVGAFADNGVPNLADLLLSMHAARHLDLGPPRAFIVGAGPRTDPDALRDRLRAALPPAATLHRIVPAATPPPEPEPLGVAEGTVIGAMTYRIRDDGFIEPDPRWVEANILTEDVPILGTVTCHRLLIPQLAAALRELERKGLAHLVDPGRYGGCYVPRFIMRDPRRGLSLHAFGLAVDFNVSTNHYGTRGDMDARVVETFDRWGFGWGGFWSPPDPMHFELERLITP